MRSTVGFKSNLRRYDKARRKQPGGASWISGSGLIGFSFKVAPVDYLVPVERIRRGSNNRVAPV
jgi:hypothetical protein